MSLDFAILGQNGAPEKTVSLGVDLHHEFVTAASGFGLTSLQKVADYYEDAEAPIADLHGLAMEISVLRAKVTSRDLLRFLDELGDLIAYAIVNGKILYAIAD